MDRNARLPSERREDQVCSASAASTPRPFGLRVPAASVLSAGDSRCNARNRLVSRWRDPERMRGCPAHFLPRRVRARGPSSLAALNWLHRRVYESVWFDRFATSGRARGDEQAQQLTPGE